MGSLKEYSRTGNNIYGSLKSQFRQRTGRSEDQFHQLPPPPSMHLRLLVRMGSDHSVWSCTRPVDMLTRTYLNLEEDGEKSDFHLTCVSSHRKQEGGGLQRAHRKTSRRGPLGEVRTMEECWIWPRMPWVLFQLHCTCFGKPSQLGLLLSIPLMVEHPQFYFYAPVAPLLGVHPHTLLVALVLGVTERIRIPA